MALERLRDVLESKGFILANTYLKFAKTPGNFHIYTHYKGGLLIPVKEEVIDTTGCFALDERAVEGTIEELIEKLSNNPIEDEEI